MADYFLDSSTLVKRYVSETGSVWLEGLFAPSADNKVFIASITRVEIVAAITRRARGNRMSSADAMYACALFRTDLTTDYQVIPIVESLLIRAMALSEARGLRGYDAIQLAVALEVNAQCLQGGLPALTMVSSDSELNAAATAEGLLVEDPNAHP